MAGIRVPLERAGLEEDQEDTVLRIKALIASLSILLLAPTWQSAFGQGGASGSITGYLYDQTGVPLKGIKLTASSPTQIGGSKVTYSNDEGFFRIPALFPGKFELKATAPKMKTYIQK